MTEQAPEYTQPQEPESLIAARKTRDSIIAKLDRLQSLHVECSEIIEGSAHVVRDATRRYIDNPDCDNPKHVAGSQLSAKRAAEAVLKEIGAIRQELNDEMREAQSAFERSVRAFDDATRDITDAEAFAVAVQHLKKDDKSIDAIMRILDCPNRRRIEQALSMNVKRWQAQE